MQATVDLLADRGLCGLNMEAVACRAGVAKTTVYRRWSSKGTLALEAMLWSAACPCCCDAKVGAM
ncbi:helix-turn-helix domain-containing protein [Caballeronia sp. 15711]|uniref:helix-turn-helix domain-containing protein n=1 Tax=Caballeronia sp. 15711 TaxID=3391029 RepID=UPI0039E4AF56